MSEVELLVKEAGLKSKGAKAMSRKHPDGQLLKWQVLRIEDHAYDDFLPFFIDWGETPHPALTTQKGCELIEFQVTHPDAHLVKIYEALRLDIQIENSDSPALKAILKSPKGEVTLIS